MRSAALLAALLCEAALADNLNCAEGSGSRSYWRIDGLVLKVYDWDNGGTTGTFGFQSYYSGTNKTVECLAKDVDLEKLRDAWSPCESAGSEFRFNFEDLSLSVRETWSCSSASLSANATGSMMLHGCLDTNTDKGIESDCNVMEFEMAANITSGSPAAPPGHHH